MLLVASRPRWRSGPSSQMSSALLGEVMQSAIKEFQVAPVQLDWSRSVGSVGGQLGSGGQEASAAVGSRVAIPGGFNDGGRPVPIELLLELLDASDAPPVLGIEGVPAGLPPG